MRYFTGAGRRRATEAAIFVLLALIGYAAGANPAKIPFIGKHFSADAARGASAEAFGIAGNGASGGAALTLAPPAAVLENRGASRPYDSAVARGEARGAASRTDSGTSRDDHDGSARADDFSPGVSGQGAGNGAQEYFSAAPTADARGEAAADRRGEKIGGGQTAGGRASSAREGRSGFLKSIAGRAARQSGFEYDSPDGAAGQRTDFGAKLGGAPGTGSGGEHSQTLFISAESADLYMDPAALESMPEDFTDDDLQRADVSYKIGGARQTISVAKGSDLMQGEQVSWSGTASEDGKWIQVSAGGIEAWVRKEQVSAPGWKNWTPGIEKAFEIGKLEKGGGLIQVAKEAEKRVGDKYVWGASSPGQFDCSGLVHYAYRRYGMQLPRVSRDQKASARPITREQMEPGDLVFTGNPVKHVMLYIGDGRLVEAMGRKYGVVYSSLNGRTGGGKPVYYGTYRHLRKK